jgi:exopolysaccharide biosynthesis polyprenyl glycosylphosphotransferase
LRSRSAYAPEEIDLREGLSRPNLRSVEAALWTDADVERARRRMQLESRLLAVGDLLAIGAVGAVVAVWSPTAVVLSAAMVLALVSSGDYRRPRVTLSVTADMPRLFSRLAIPVLFVAVDAALHPVKRWVFSFVVAAAVAVVASRFITFGIVRFLRVRRVTTQRAVVVGAGLVGAQLAAFLEKHAALGIEPVGLVDDSNPETGLPVLGPVQKLPEILRAYGARYVLLAFGSATDTDTVDVLRSLPAGRVEIFIVPRFFEVGAAAGDPLVDDAWGIPLIWLRRRASRETMLRAKRAFDVVVALAVLLLTLPLLAAGALAVAVTSKGPILFRQRRIGQHGRPFDLLKLRSMELNTDSDTTWSVSTDIRVTRVGRVLRRTSLDELPQLFNVLNGDMSLVGPRPERPYYVTEFAKTVPRYQDRHRAPVGLTGWAQIHGLRGNSSIDDRVRFDNIYIEHWSIWRDLSILARTLSAMLRGE